MKTLKITLLSFTFLFSSLAWTTNDINEKLLAAAKAGDEKAVDSLLKEGAFIEASDEKGWTALMWASHNGRKNTVVRLLKENPKVDPSRKSTATYQLEFHATWSATTHPNNFPFNPHFSGLIGGVHNDSVHFWERGESASNGMEVMAETGSKSPLNNEVKNAIEKNKAMAIISGPGISNSPGMASIPEITVSDDFPLITVVAMIAPSPDWFVGVSGLSLKHNGRWMLKFVVDLYPYDAGTDDGMSYTSPNKNSNPRKSITSLQGMAPFSNNKIGTFIFTRTQSSCCSALSLAKAGGHKEIVALLEQYEAP